MKHSSFILLLYLILTILSSCSVDPSPYSTILAHNKHPFTLSNKVSLEEAYEMASILTKGAEKSVSVEPVIDEDGDTLMYFVNLARGWKILSADKRTPAVIAESSVGSISLTTDNGGLLSWLGITAADMKQIIHSDDCKLNFSSEQIKSHRQQWSKEPIRFQGDSLPIIPHLGEWELQYTSTSEVYYNHLNHLVCAHWDQWEPYNYYCPPLDSGSGNQPAGCSPVAFGQLLQFLCNHFDIPFSFYWNGLWGDIDDVVPEYTASFEGDYTTPLLLRYIGDVFNADYEDDGTGVHFAELKMKNFLSNMNINCTKQDYSASKVIDNLMNGLPILVGGYADSFFFIPTHGHSYLIDGYKLTRTRTIDAYARLQGYPPILEERYDTTYSSPHINAIKMNWGWWMQWGTIILMMIGLL